MRDSQSSLAASDRIEAMNYEVDDAIALLARDLSNIDICERIEGHVNVLAACAGALYALREAKRHEKNIKDYDQYVKDPVVLSQDIRQVIGSVQQGLSTPIRNWIYGYEINNAGLRINMALNGTLDLLNSGRKEQLGFWKLVAKAEEMGLLPGKNERDKMYLFQLRENFRNVLEHRMGLRLDPIQIEMGGRTQVECLTAAMNELVPIFGQIVGGSMEGHPKEL
jgi:hypothetical protein